MTLSVGVLECPFCGGKSIEILPPNHETGGWSFSCEQCRNMVVTYPTEFEAALFQYKVRPDRKEP